MIVQKLKPEVKEKFLKALRSGEYKQISQVLHKKNIGFCCLGVLSDLYLKEKKLEWIVPEFGLGLSFPNENLECKSLPQEVSEWCGFEKTDNRFPSNIYIETYLRGNEQSCSLMFLNDNLSMSFEEIANIVEKQL